MPIVPVTVFVAVSITETLLSVTFVTYAVEPSGLIAISAGFDPTVMVPVMVLVTVSITDNRSRKAGW